MSLSLLADRSNLSLNSVKKRQRTKKFAMTEGSWTGPEGPIGDYKLFFGHSHCAFRSMFLQQLIFN